MSNLAGIEVTHSLLDLTQFDEATQPAELIKVIPQTFWLVLGSVLLPDAAPVWERAHLTDVARIPLYPYLTRDMQQAVSGYQVQLGAVATQCVPPQYKNRVRRFHIVQGKQVERGTFEGVDALRMHIGFAVLIGGQP